MKRPTVCLLLLLTSLLAVICNSSAAATATPGDNGKPLVVGVRDGSPPFSSVNPATGKPEGFEVDLANALSKAMGKPFELRTVTGDGRVPMLQSHQIDLVIAVLTITPEREKQVSFSEPYFPSLVGVLVSKGSPIMQLKDLAGKTSCAPKGTVNQQVLEASYAKMFGAAKFGELQLSSYQLCTLALRQGRADFITTDLGTALGLSKQDDTLRVLDKYFPGLQNAIGVAKDKPELVQDVNKGLKKLFTDGTWKELYLKWIGPPIPEGWPPGP